MFLNIAYITKVNLASLNGTESSGGNLTEIKKISSYSGDEFVYISGQALRRYLKETLLQLGEKISGVDEGGNPEIVYNKELIGLNKKLDESLQKAIFENVCDLDIFGYMLPKEGNRRWSPIKVTPMISLLPFKGETDLLIRKQKTDNKNSANLVQVEIDTLNFMRGNYMINCSHIGHLINEYTYESKKILSDDKIKQRLNVLLDAIKNLNGGAKQARNLEDISPKFIVVIKQKTGNPFLLNSLEVDKNGNLNIDLIKENLAQNEFESYKIGLSSGIFANENEIKKELNTIGIKEAIDFYKEV
ncbi:type I-B CRISPR-associated protein Cas7/Cst2/DevR [Campylobacter geochelonis]|uniref:type I-B CRISPR-associated protein Cas7/Cst2/DevR n=1 Tax=Campylobacter geochelonis TaxID=1780362 RepID=UPI0007707B59|nr:type I-B CRISPR-associated protein Cas7/Cst2/DevR [Campylobacter geochelonis]CZE47549.1 CRISPR-associated protein Cas7/Cst2/DevR%2C subtype I-B/TNEAP [Campylobacter geochelonis]CZE50215.1 CRISPR-associated protein Cas7/Cst2/DevR%2C subtype I-B/TNEAP [Campylobacter geochelonis]